MSKITNPYITISEAVAAVAEGNPGAISAMASCMKAVSLVDPQHILGPAGIILQLDSFEIYGPRVWMLFKDVCGQDAKNMIAALRSVQLGLRTREQLNEAIDNYGRGWNCDDVLAEVKSELSGFDGGAAS